MIILALRHTENLLSASLSVPLGAPAAGYFLLFPGGPGAQGRGPLYGCTVHYPGIWGSL